MIQVNNLTKKYGSFTAVDKATIVALPNEITVLLGPNGAGKSTTIKSIAGLLKYAGDIEINGYVNSDLEAKRGFGYIPEVPTLYDILTVDEHINFISKAYSLVDDENHHEFVSDLLERFNIEDKRKTVAKKLSKGMRQKLSMILALITKPKSLLIDEPLIGLDPNAIEDVLKMLIELKHEGTAILISTHIIDVVDDIWDKAYIMNHGKIVAEVRKDELLNRSLKEVYFEHVKDHE